MSAAGTEGGQQERPASSVDIATSAPLAAIEDRVILDELSDAVVAADDGNRIIYCNPAAERLLGWSRGDLQGKSLLAIVPERLRDAHLTGFSRYLTTGVPTLIGNAVRVAALHRDGHEVAVELTLAAFRAGDDRQVFVASFRDLADRVELERQTAMTSYFKATTEVAVLLGLSGTVKSLESAAPLVLAAIGTSLAWQVGALWLVDGDVVRCVDVWHEPGFDAAEFVALTRAAQFPRGVGLPGHVWRATKPVWIEDFAANSEFPRAAWALERGLRTAFGFPVMSEGRCLGVVEFFHRDRKASDPDLLGVVATVGGQLGQFLERRRAEHAAQATSERFASLARTLQASLLPPHLPDIQGLDVAAAYRPAGAGIDVGGDFYDVFPARGTGWGVVMGDVCGKGAEAATLTALARYTVRAAVMRARRPRNVLSLLNEAVMRQDEHGRFITVAYGALRCFENHVEVVVSLGGHPQPVLLRADGTASVVGRPGTVLGVVERPELFDQAVLLVPGDALVFYTDGVTEARGAEGQFGEERLLTVVEEATGAGAAGLVAAIEGAVNRFEGGVSRDDLALLVVRVPPRRDAD
ncbi:MAG: SpoIIE family protein phosphatase [Actinobacteria bacterium]|nr:SpoIIE family protein phosphatase [Actinomycetota bacterium]